MAANKFKNIRAAVCWNTKIASLVRQHNNANILCIPARFVSVEEAIAILEIFLVTKESNEVRHVRRRNHISKIN